MPSSQHPLPSESELQQHEHKEESGVLKTTAGCKNGCEKCLSCPRKTRGEEGGQNFLTQISINDFLSTLFNNLEKIGIDLSGLVIDHIAYRAAIPDEGDALRTKWDATYSLLKSAQINGREVLVYQCEPPIQYEQWSISGLELMYPKPSKPFGGWDHIEVVLGPYNNSIDVLREKLGARFPDIQRNAGENYSYEEDGLHAVGGQVINPCISIRFSDKTAVRFHTADIREIIEMEE